MTWVLSKAEFGPVGRVLILSLAAGLLPACGGGGSGSEPTAPVAVPNQAPVISGTPGTQVQAGATYAFTPSATDADHDSLTFSIANKPSWATFNATTGQLSGTPTSANAGVYSGVTITVSDGKASANLAAFSITVSAQSSGTGSATLSWVPPTQYSDGSTLVLSGYRISYGTSPDSYSTTIAVTNPGLSSYVIDNLTSGTYYFIITALDAAGVESPQSSPVSKTIS